MKSKTEFILGICLFRSFWSPLIFCSSSVSLSLILLGRRIYARFECTSCYIVINNWCSSLMWWSSCDGSTKKANKASTSSVFPIQYVEYMDTKKNRMGCLFCRFCPSARSLSLTHIHTYPLFVAVSYHQRSNYLPWQLPT